MSKKQSIANKRRWKKIPKEKRSSVMSNLATIRWSKISPEMRHEYAMKMVAYRKNKTHANRV